MSDFGTEELARDAIEIVNGGVEVLTWNGAEYDGMVGALVTTNPNQQGGFLPEYDLSWSTSMQKFNDAKELVDRFLDDDIPDEGDVVTLRDVDYRVERISKDPFETMVQFDLVNENKQ